MIFLRNFCKTTVRDTIYHVAHSLYHVSSSSSLVEGKLFFSVSESDFSFPAAKKSLSRNYWFLYSSQCSLDMYCFYIMWIFSLFSFCINLQMSKIPLEKWLECRYWGLFCNLVVLWFTKLFIFSILHSYYWENPFRNDNFLYIVNFGQENT